MILGLWAVVNNAAIRRDLDIELVPVELMKRVAEVNFYGMVRVTKAFIPMIRKSKGKIIKFNSLANVWLPTRTNAAAYLSNRQF